MPVRLRLGRPGTEQKSSPPPQKSSPPLEGLSDQSTGAWCTWLKVDAASRQPVTGVDRDVQELNQDAGLLIDALPDLAASLQRSDEDLVDWLISERHLQVDLSLPILLLGRDLSLLGNKTRLVVEGA